RQRCVDPCGIQIEGTAPQEFRSRPGGRGGAAMRGKVLAVLLLAGLIGAGCSAAQLKANKDNSWNDFPRALPDSYDGNPGGYGHPFRGLAFALSPVGVALDYVLIRPFYLLGGLAPE